MQDHDALTHERTRYMNAFPLAVLATCGTVGFGSAALAFSGLAAIGLGIAALGCAGVASWQFYSLWQHTKNAKQLMNE
jgi:hypothetical protein